MYPITSLFRENCHPDLIWRKNYRKDAKSEESVLALSVQKKGVEPSRYYYHTDLNRARLPIPPLLQTIEPMISHRLNTFIIPLFSCLSTVFWVFSTFYFRCFKCSLFPVFLKNKCSSYGMFSRYSESGLPSGTFTVKNKEFRKRNSRAGARLLQHPFFLKAECASIAEHFIS